MAKYRKTIKINRNEVALHVDDLCSSTKINLYRLSYIFFEIETAPKMQLKRKKSRPNQKLRKITGLFN
jgi:hypothetical protein